MNAEIEKADVICLVYALNNQESKERLVSYWLPKINEIEKLSDSTSPTKPNEVQQTQTKIDPKSSASFQRRPIILVGNKCDTERNDSSVTNDRLISQLIIKNSQIETCIICSAKSLQNVPEVFYYAQKSVLYPTQPIYDNETKQLTSKAVKCLTRIFKLCDNDNDGLLNDKELNEFQIKCFGMSLNQASLQEVKLFLTLNDEKNDYLKNNEVTLSGFLHLNILFIKKGRHETTWTILKKFGYDRNLDMSRDYAFLK